MKLNTAQIATGILVISLVPIWKVPGVDGGQNLWRYFILMADKPHLPVEEAQSRANFAHQEGYI